MAERKPLVLIDGQLQELPVGDTVTGSSGSGSSQTGSEIASLLDAHFGNNEWRSSVNFKGVYTDKASLDAAHASALVGNYAFVDAGVGNDPEFYVWDGDDNEWKMVTGAGTMTGSQIEAILDAYYGDTSWRDGSSSSGGSSGVALDNFRHVGMDASSYSGTGPGYFEIPFAQAVANQWQEVGVTPNSEFIIPVGKNFIEITAGLRVDGGTNIGLEIFLQQWNGSDWDFLTGSRYDGSYNINNISSGVLPVSGGERFRLVYYASTSWTPDDTACFWSIQDIPANTGSNTVTISQESSDFSITDSMLEGQIYKEVDSTAANVTITVPENLTGTEPLTFEQIGTNDVEFIEGTNVTINSFEGYLKIAGQFGTATLVPKGGNTYSLIGNLKS